MSSRDVLYRSVLRGGQSECPQMPSDLSPMSNLALTLHGASLTQTPKRKLSLSSTLSDTPQSCHDASSLLCSSLLQDSHSPDSTSSSCEEPPVSPSHRLASRDKENFPSSYYSPSRSPVILPRSRASPLQDVQNTVNRNLSFSPLKKNLQLVSPSKRVFTSPPKPSPPDDFDTNSHDSGYSESGKKMEEDCFSVPVSCAPRKLNLDLSPPKPRMISPVKSVSTVVSSITTVPTIFTAVTSTPASSSSGSEGRRPFRKFSSLSKGDEEDTMLMDLMNEMTTQEEQQPLGFSNLLLAPIQPPSATTSSRSILDGRPSIRRCLSMVDTTPTSSRVESISKTPSLENSRPSTVSFKRPQPPTDSNFSDCKRRKPDESCDQLSPLTSNASTTTGEKIRTPLTHRQVSAPEPSTSQAVKPKLQRCLSESHVSIMKALNKSSGHDGDLIGDFSKPVLLPVVEGGKHPDLKAISVETLAEVVRGKFNSKVASYRIIDCRYPYEFEGGHVTGAEMWHHPKMVEENLNAQKGAPVIVNEEAPRQILIFHCEFSAERGPKAQRLLREMDRTANKEHYPALHFPEMYLLEGGYKAFFEKYPELCTPKDYVKMLDSNHVEDLKHFRGKSKSWAAENKQSKSRTTLPRPGLKRLGL